MKATMSFIGATGLAVALSATAFAQQQVPRGQLMQRGPSVSHGNIGQAGVQDAPTFAELDKKGRGFLRRSDIPKDVPILRPLRVYFSEYDLDRDGQLSRQEYAIFIKPMVRPDS